MYVTISHSPKNICCPSAWHHDNQCRAKKKWAKYRTPAKTSLSLMKIFTIQCGKCKYYKRVTECYGDAEGGGRTSTWDDQKMHHEGSRRRVDLFTVVGDQDREMGIRGRGQ